MTAAPASTTTPGVWSGRFGLRTMFALLLLSGLVFGYGAKRWQALQRERAAVAQWTALEALVLYDYQWDSNLGDYVESLPPRGPAWLHATLGSDCLAEVRGIWAQGPIEAPALQALQNLPGLKDLDLEEPALTSAALQELGRLQQLESLSLYRPEYLTADWGAALGRLHGLRRLSIQNAEFSSASLAPLVKLKSLRELNLGGSNVNDASVGELVALPLLEMLDLSRTAVTNSAIPALAQLKQLRRLDLRQTELTDLRRLREALPQTRIVR